MRAMGEGSKAPKRRTCMNELESRHLNASPASRRAARQAIDGGLSRDRGRLLGLWRRWDQAADDAARRKAFEDALVRSRAQREARAVNLPRGEVEPSLLIAGEADLELTDALVQVSARRPLCLTPALDSITTPSMRWRPVRMVLAAGPDRIISGGDTLTVHQLGMTGLAGSVWSEAARDVYDLAARRNQSLCNTLLIAGDLKPNLPSMASCRPE